VYRHPKSTSGPKTPPRLVRESRKWNRFYRLYGFCSRPPREFADIIPFKEIKPIAMRYEKEKHDESASSERQGR
jgi:hypothetical protein